jgi:hypothetical protein
MREINIKDFLSRHRKGCVMLAVFVLALLLGFSGGRNETQSRDRVRFRDLYLEMRRVLRILEPVVKPSVAAENKINTDPAVQGLAGLITRGILSQLPDGSWNEEAFVTRGEALFYFAQILQSLESDMVYPPMLLEITPEYADIFSEHWLYVFLPKLAGIGALSSFKAGRLNPDAILQAAEMRNIGSAIIDYLGSNLLILKYDGNDARLYAKGALQELNVTEWSYSFNRRDWYQIGKDGELLPEFKAGRLGSVLFKHPSYREAGPIMLKEKIASIGMIKLQRNYADFTSSRVFTKKNDSTPDSEEERARIRSRLAQIRERLESRPAADRPRVIERHASAVANVAATSDVSRGSDRPAIKTAYLNEHSEAADQGEETYEQHSHAEGSATYEGRVVDALSSEALKGAVVIISSRQYTADDHGKFSFAAAPNSIVDLTAYSEGYEVLKIRHRAGYRAGPLTLTLKPVFVSCAGQVTSFVDDRPVARALVKIGNRATRTSSDGRFALKGVKPGFHQISVFARDYMEAHEISHIGAETAQEINMRLRPMYSDSAVFADSYQN